MSSSRLFPQRVSIVSSLEVPKRDFRLDPTRYNERSERIIRHLKKQGTKTVRIGDWDGVSRVFVAPRFKRPYVTDEKQGVPFLGSSSMLALRLPRDALLAKTFKKLPALILHGGELLLTCSGTIGVSALCGDSYRGYAVSQHAARLYVRKGVRGYLHAFLSSKAGRELVIQQNYGKVIKELTEDQIRSVSVPLVDDAALAEINGMMLDAAEKYDSARVLLRETEEDVPAALNDIPSQDAASLWTSMEHNCFLKSSGGLFNYRLDPHFHRPDVLALRNTITRKPHVLLGGIADVWMPPRFARPPARPGHGIDFYTSADMMRARRTPTATVSRKAKKYLDQCKVRTGMTLLCRSGAFGGIMGRATFVSPGADGWAVTEDMVRCSATSNEYMPEYLFAVLSCLSVAYPLITAFRYGKDVPHIDPSELKAIPIPTLTSSARSKIGGKIKAAYLAVDEANALEAQAVGALCQAIGWHGEVEA